MSELRDKLPKDWLSYDVQRKQNELSSPSENAVRLAFTYHKRDITAGNKELREKEPEILKQGLQKDLIARLRLLIKDVTNTMKLLPQTL